MSGKIQTKIISFRHEYLAEYEYLQQCGNASRLVCELVRQYRMGNKSNSKLPYINGNNSNNKGNSYNDDVIDSAKGLLE